MAINHADSTHVERPAARVAPEQRSEPIVDLSRREDTAVLDRTRTQFAGVENRGVQRDVGNPTFAITDGDRVVAGADKKPLSDNSLNAAKVKNGEGYFQSAERLLGGEFTHNEKKQFTDALRKNWATEHPDSKTLRRNDQLLTEKNRDAVLNNIADPALRARIAERLNKGLPEGNIPKPEPRPKREEDARPVDPKIKDKPAVIPNRIETPDARVKPVVPTEFSSVPDGPVKNPLDAKFDVGDRFTALSSNYGRGFHGKQTASGIRYDQNMMTLAHRDLPFGTILEATNPHTGKKEYAVVTDNGPFAGTKRTHPDGRVTHDRRVDMSVELNRRMGNIGLGNVEFKVVHIPEGGAWGKDRRNLTQAQQRELMETARRLTRR